MTTSTVQIFEYKYFRHQRCQSAAALMPSGLAGHAATVTAAAASHTSQQIGRTLQRWPEL